MNQPFVSLIQYQVMDVFPSKVRFTSYVYHSDSSTADAPNLLLTDGSEYFDVFFGEDFIGPSLDNPNFTVSNDMFMSWKEDPLCEYSEICVSQSPA